MSYLSRRMREDGWPRRRPGELTITIDVDLSRLTAAFERASRACSDLAERAGLPLLDPWQEALLDAMWRVQCGSPPLWPPRPARPPIDERRLIAITTPGESSGLAELAAKVRRERSQPFARVWLDEVLEYREGRGEPE